MKLAALLVLFALTSSSMAWAEPSSSADQAAAAALFDEGKTLFDQGKPAEALRKFEASEKLDPSVGALLNVARCHEALGQLASAYGAYDAALAMARANADDRASAIAEQKSALEPRLSRLRIDVANGVRVTKLQIDGKPLPDGAIGTAFPIDPGKHVIEAERNGEPFRGEVTIGGPGPTAFSIPAPTPPPPPPFWNGHRIGAVTLGGVALAGIVVGSVFGVRAGNSLDASQPHCKDLNPDPCDLEGVSLRDQSNREAWVSNVAFGISGAAIVGGVVLLLTSPRGKAATTGSWQPVPLFVGKSGVVTGMQVRF